MNKMTKKSKKPSCDIVNDPAATYEQITKDTDVTPKEYTSSEDFWKRQTEKTKEFCKKNGLL